MAAVLQRFGQQTLSLYPSATGLMPIARSTHNAYCEVLDDLHRSASRDLCKAQGLMIRVARGLMISLSRLAAMIARHGLPARLGWLLPPALP